MGQVKCQLCLDLNSNSPSNHTTSRAEEEIKHHRRSIRVVDYLQGVMATANKLTIYDAFPPLYLKGMYPSQKE